MFLFLPAAAMAFTTSGCFLESHSHTTGSDTIATGTLSIAWTVESSTSPSACDAHNATDIAIDIYDPAGNRIATEKAPCDAFVDNVDLDVGSYSIDVTLVDINDKSVTTTITLDTTVDPNTEVDVDVDFPPTSFL
ncbi:MAG: hypothetical protein U0441_23840 [Polyangiaceae bacterium]